MDYDYIRRILLDLKDEYDTWVAMEKMCSVHASGLARIAKGKAIPSNDTLQKLHNAFPDVFPELKFAESTQSFGMSLAAIKRIQGRKDLEEIPTFAIPVFDAGSGEPSSFEDGGYPVGKSSQYESIPAHGADPNTFGVRIHGYSMSPRLMPGDIVIVDPSAQIEPGQICFAALPDGRRLVKRYFQQGNGVIVLRSDNPDKKEFPDMRLTKDENNNTRIYRVKRRIEEL